MKSSSGETNSLGIFRAPFSLSERNIQITAIPAKPSVRTNSLNFSVDS